MKTSEMYAIAEVNPEAKFKRPNLNDTTYMFDENGILVNLECGEYTASVILPKPNEEWELIPQEVTWQEAIQAWVDGNKVYYVLNGVRRSYLDDVEYLRVFDGCRPISKDEISKGKWYIE